MFVFATIMLARVVKTSALFFIAFFLQGCNQPKRTPLFHYTSKESVAAIEESKVLKPSKFFSVNWKKRFWFNDDTAYGEGVYLTDLKPSIGSKELAKLGIFEPEACVTIDKEVLELFYLVRKVAENKYLVTDLLGNAVDIDLVALGASFLLLSAQEVNQGPMESAIKPFGLVFAAALIVGALLTIVCKFQKPQVENEPFKQVLLAC